VVDVGYGNQRTYVRLLRVDASYPNGIRHMLSEDLMNAFHGSFDNLDALWTAKLYQQFPRFDDNLNRLDRHFSIGGQSDKTDN
jgi:hypothetical protein